jgi:hypothetical protein
MEDDDVDGDRDDLDDDFDNDADQRPILNNHQSMLESQRGHTCKRQTSE